MLNSFKREKQIFAAIHSYITMLQELPAIRAYSGATRLYLMTGLGVTISSAGSIDMLRADLAKDGSLIDPPLTYVYTSIVANCNTYAELLKNMIFRRLKTRGTQDQPTASKTSRRLSYNISLNLAKQLHDLTDGSRQLWDQDTLYQNVEMAARVEYALLVETGGIGLPNVRCDHGIRMFLDKWLLNAPYSGTTTYDPLKIYVPGLSIVLIIARMLYGDFDECDQVPPMGGMRDRLKLSTSTLAALPWPSIEFAEGFSEPEAGYLDQSGWRYLHHISRIYPDCLMLGV